MATIIKAIKFTGKGDYYQFDKLREIYPLFCKGCRSGNEFITKKKIDEKNYMFATIKDNKWHLANGKSKKNDKILVSVNWIKENIPELVDNKEKIEHAPDTIELKDNEKFRDSNGNIIEIEVRGVREYDKCYFKVKDVMEGFEMKTLDRVLIDKDTNYELNKDYKNFICRNGNNVSKNTIKKELYLTYTGMLRVLFTARSGIANNFVGWATKSLFAIQMGTKIQKESLVADILGVPAKTVKEVFSQSCYTLPCIYLFSLGKVENLRKTFNISDKYGDDDIVYKYGMTKNLTRRTEEHIATYGKMDNVELKLKYYSYVDPQYISSAETDIRNIVGALNLNYSYDTHKELVIISKDFMPLVKKQFEQISANYIGHISELVTKIKELEAKIEMMELKHKNELMEEKHRREMIEKDMRYKEEIYALKDQLYLKK